MKVKAIFAAIMLIAAVGVASAQNTNQTKNSESRKTCYVDANKNGVCDNYENGKCAVGNGKGLRDGSGRKNGNGQGRGYGKRDGSGRANGGRGANYVDANNNGICDHRENANKK